MVVLLFSGSLGKLATWNQVCKELKESHPRITCKGWGGWVVAQCEAPHNLKPMGRCPAFLAGCPKLPSAPSPVLLPATSHFGRIIGTDSGHSATQHRPLLPRSSSPHCHTVICKNKRSIVTCHRDENCSGEETGNILYYKVTKDLKVILPTRGLIYTGHKKQPNKNLSKGLCHKEKCSRAKIVGGQEEKER